MLSLRGVEVDVLRKMIATTNKSLQLPSSAQMEISLINGPTSHVVSGAPQLLTELLLDLMEQSAGKKFKIIIIVVVVDFKFFYYLPLFQFLLSLVFAHVFLLYISKNLPSNIFY